MAVFTNQSKNSATFLNFLRHGKETVINDIANFTFNDVVFPDGTQLKDVTFNDLVEQVWANINKSSTPIFTNATKN
ncbi:MAG: hypothetical protein UU10_C0007G0005 [Parcubacteria group bacterium GW2011_GWF1_40_6]|nr:MAG: hypothetical protein UU10_C0007G0005 [Parcubacteria group bacterium GW2011_GWF1_40_6]